MNQVGPVREGAHERNGEPVSRRLAQTGLALHVVRQVRQSVALRVTALVGDLFVTPGERNRLERQEGDTLWIIKRELNDAADLLVIQTVDDGYHRHDLDPRLMQVLDRLQLYVKQVADEAMRVGSVADAVELKVRVTQAGFCRLLRKLETLGKLDAV